MLCIRRTFEAPDLGLRVESHLGLAEGHRIVATALGPGTVFDPRLLPPEPSLRRAYVYVVLEGESLLGAEARPAPSSTVLLAEARATAQEREFLHAVGPHRALAVQLSPELLTHTGATRWLTLDEAGRGTAERLHRALSTGADFEDLQGAHEGFVLALRHAGLVSLGSVPLVRPSERHVAFAGALSSALAMRSELPAIVDLVGPGAPSERTVRRLFGEIASRYGWVYRTWQPLRRQWSTILACLMLAVPGSRPEQVARWAGFASLTSLHHALSRVGMPTPRELQELATTIASTRPGAPPRRNC